MRGITKIIVVAGLATTALPGIAFGAPIGGNFRSPDAQEVARPTTSVTDLRSPDARDSARGTYGSYLDKASETPDLRSPDARDTTAAATYTSSVASTPSVAEGLTNGFQWSDAGIGAAAMLGLIALCGGMLLLVSSRRRERHAPRTIG